MAAKPESQRTGFEGYVYDITNPHVDVKMPDLTLPNGTKIAGLSYEEPIGAGIVSVNISLERGIKGLPIDSPPGAARSGAFKEAKRQNGIPVSEQPVSVTKPNKYKGQGREYEFKDGTKIRDDAFGHKYPDDPTQNRGPHFNDPAGRHYDY